MKPDNKSEALVAAWAPSEGSIPGAAALLIVVFMAIVISILSTMTFDTIVVPAHPGHPHPPWQSQTRENKEGTRIRHNLEF